MAERLRDWPSEAFIDAALAKLPAPRSPETGELLWERGIRLQGNQAGVLKSRARFKQARGGWRAGKSFVAAAAIYLDLGWREVVRGVGADLYGIIGDSYQMAEEEMRHLDKMLTAMEIPHELRTPEKQAWVLTFPHKAAEVRTMTAADVTKIASRAYRGMVLAEGAQLAADVYTNAKGRVLETGGWILIEGTFEGDGAWFYQIAEDWQAPGAEGETFPLPSWENLVNFPGGRQDPKILAFEHGESALPPDVFLEKMGGEARKRSDLVMRYADRSVHVRQRYPRLGYSFDPEQPVVLAIDPGIGHAYAVMACQFEKPRPEAALVTIVIDAVYRWGRTAEQVIEECAAKPWARNVSEAVMDFAGTQRRSEGPPNTVQWTMGWRQLCGMPLMIHANPVPLHAGYDVHKRCLLNSWDERDAQLMFNSDKKLTRVTNQDGPKLFISPDAAPCLFGGIVDGQRYLGEYNLHRNKKDRHGTITRDDPVDIDNDAIKALSYILYWRYGAFGDRSQLIGFDTLPWELKLGA